eukprot:TRINITY_DN27976_c0_g1_i1.p1 TRINITY_DN27976_c0_g1~~TRINITY_DN27976_c0_g1_i1.p1  ORF type:complete len:266 (-),score=36.64 TRINITY_DN27976_c0_g1_i1:11-784(-)
MIQEGDDSVTKIRAGLEDNIIRDISMSALEAEDLATLSKGFEAAFVVDGNQTTIFEDLAPALVSGTNQQLNITTFALVNGIRATGRAGLNAAAQGIAGTLGDKDEGLWITIIKQAIHSLGCKSVQQLVRETQLTAQAGAYSSAFARQIAEHNQTVLKCLLDCAAFPGYVNGTMENQRIEILEGIAAARYENQLVDSNTCPAGIGPTVDDEQVLAVCLLKQKGQFVQEKIFIQGRIGGISGLGQVHPSLLGGSGQDHV